MTFPRPTTTLIGRKRELEILARAEAPIVTLVGLGGVGKTRLAHAHAASFRGETVHVDLVGARTASDLCARVAAALDVRVDKDIASRIGDVLSQRGRTLVVLDNFEQLEEDAARCLERWSSPEVTLLATSQRVLGARGELVVHVEPLPVEGDALELFMARATSRAHPADDERIALEIVRRLEGIPLAIELAAARLDVLSLAQISARLGERFALLRNPMTPGDRHGTMSGVLEWSWDLLEPWQKSALAQASVFEGPFTIDDASAVLDGEALDAIHALVRHSLARIHDDERFSILETVREFAAQKLGDAVAVRDRHARHFADAAFALAVLDRGPSHVLPKLQRWRDDLMAALRHALATKDGARAAKAVIALAPLLTPSEQRLQWIDRALAAIGRDGELALRLRHARTQALRTVGRLDEAMRECDEALASATGAIASMFEEEAIACETVRGNLSVACERATRAIAAWDASMGPRRLALLLWRRAYARMDAGDFDTALEDAERMVAMVDDPGDRTIARITIGACAYEKGDLDVARAHFDAAKDTADATGDVRHAAVALGYRGGIAHEREDWPTAQAEYEGARSTFARVGERRLEAIYRGYSGIVLAQRGELERAEPMIESARAFLERTPDPRYEAALEGALVAIRALRGDLDGAKRALCDLEAKRSVTTLPALVAVYRKTIEALEGNFEAVEKELGSLARPDVEDVRLAFPFLRRAIRVARDRARAWGFDSRGVAFVPPSSPLVRLETRGPLTRIVAALVRHRLDHPGAALGKDALIRVAWPDEQKISHDSARNRLKVAVSTLRKAGLEPLLLTHANGYLLDPNVPIRIEDV